MLAIVRLALRRTYTFVVMAILIAICGTLAAIRTPVDIFPNIGIPVISPKQIREDLPVKVVNGTLPMSR
jgi:Cu/Ag efflux pump CusA